MPVGKFAQQKAAPAAAAGASKFGKGAAAKPAAGKPAGKKVSRYGGIEAAQRDPMPDVGRHVVRFVSSEEAVNPGTHRESIKSRVEVVESGTHREGETLMCLFMRTSPGLADFKRLVMGFGGVEDEETYNAFDNPEDGEFLAAVNGYENDFSAAGITLVGRLAILDVTRGNAIKDEAGNDTGDFYRRFKWTVIEDDNQEVPNVLAQAEAAAA